MRWRTGRIDRGRAWLIAERTAPLSPSLREAVQERILPIAEDRSAGNLRGLLDRAVIAADPHAAENRERKAKRDRELVLRSLPDGMASVRANAPADAAMSIFTLADLLADRTGADDDRPGGRATRRRLARHRRTTAHPRLRRPHRPPRPPRPHRRTGCSAGHVEHRRRIPLRTPPATPQPLRPPIHRRTGIRPRRQPRPDSGDPDSGEPDSGDPERRQTCIDSAEPDALTSAATTA